MPDGGSFGSDDLGASGSFSVKFDQPGTVPIHCSLRPRMKATIIVDPPDGTASRGPELQPQRRTALTRCYNPHRE
jgi:hypothetical protein